MTRTNGIHVGGRRATALCLTALLCALLLAACNGDDPTPTPQINAEAPTATAIAPSPLESDTAAEASPAGDDQNADQSAEPPATDIQPGAEQAAPAPTVAVAEEPANDCEIEPSPDLIGYNDVVTRLGCPIADATNDPVGLNEFGDGPDYKRFMLWFGAEGQIYVLSEDGRWLAYTDSWEEGDPEISCNPDNVNPATSPPLPRRGFGKLWCTVDTVRASMGLIDREERLCQHAVVQRFDRGRLLACFEDATIRYFRILNDGAWDMETVQ